MRSNFKSLSSEELPREKAIRHGINNLANHELLAIILRTGTAKCNVIDLAYDMLASNNGIFGLAQLSYEELKQISGLKEAKALALISTFEIAKRINNHVEYHNKIETPEQIFNFLKPKLITAMQEKFYVIFLNSKNYMTSYKELFIGGLNKNIVQPRDIFRESVKNNAASIILVHNHPSGDPTPSIADIEITKELLLASEIIGIKIVDHIIIGKTKYASLKALNII